MSSSSEHRRVVVLGLVLFGAALVVRLPGLGRSLFYDELFTARHFTDTLAHAVFAQKQANNHPLASLLAWASCRVLGEGSFALRLPSVLVGALAVVATAWLGARRSRTTGALAGLLALVHPAHVGFSQEVRGYALVLLFTPLIVRLTVEVLEGERRLVGCLCVCVGLGLWAHLTTGVVALGLVAYASFARGDRKGALGGLVAGGLLGLVLVAPVLSHVGKFAQGHVGLSGEAGGWPTPERLGAVVEMLSCGDARLGPFVPLALALGTLVAISLRALPGSSAERGRAGEAARAVTLAILCILVATAVVWLAARPLFYARFFAFLLPLAVVLAASGAVEVARVAFGNEKRSVVVALPLVLGWALATGERAGWETQPVDKALAYARSIDEFPELAGVGSEEVSKPSDRGLTLFHAADAVAQGARPRLAVVELFPRPREVFAGWVAARDLVDEPLDFPGLYSPVRVHLLRRRP